MMSKDELIELDNYGHKPLNGLTKEQLVKYYSLLQKRLHNVADYLAGKHS